MSNVTVGPWALQRRSGDGSGGDGMEGRIATLEVKMDHVVHRLDKVDARLDKVDGRLTDIQTVLARIEAELKHRVDYKWLTVYVLGIAALILREEIAALFR